MSKVLKLREQLNQRRYPGGEIFFFTADQMESDK